MSIIKGAVKRDESPKVRVQLVGMTQRPVEVECTIDTGFNGFVSMPMSKAISLGLILDGTSKWTLANGAEHKSISAIGGVIIDGRMEAGSFALHDGDGNILLGMEFLIAFGLTLVLNATGNEVFLLDQQLLVSLISGASESMGSRE